MLKRSSILLWLLIVNLASAEEDVIAVTENSTVSIKCPVKCSMHGDETVAWDNKPYGQSTPRHVHDGMRFLNGFKSDRISLDSSSQHGRCNLLINNVKPNDAGIFICRDTSDYPKEWSTNLVVTGTLECNVKVPTDMYIGENEFGLAHTAITFRCTLLYRGNRHLALKMTLYGKEYQWATHKLEHNPDFQKMIYGELRPVSTTKNMKNGVFVCGAIIKNSTAGYYHNTTNIRWQSVPLDIKFAKLENRPVAECPRVASSLNCNPPCTYEQKQYSNGTYYCQSNYTLDGQTYTKQVISYFNGYVSNSGAKKFTIWEVTVTIILIVVLILVVYLGCISREKITNFFKPAKVRHEDDAKTPDTPNAENTPFTPR